MNTASRMESTGMRGKIQVSQETADRLITAGKTNWITPREDKVKAKGKGDMQTFWVMGEGSKPNTVTDQTETSRGSFLEDIYETPAVIPSADPYAEAKQERLVKWNVEVLMNLLKQIQAHRQSNTATTEDRKVH
ncbi:MAG: adenylate/guanylate cyclase domain-containing protein, partial [Kangiellaceae bacterium]|nr:adenylate/guanylate cyclase domain-containing protein [Kangiellaceae bacterium]